MSVKRIFPRRSHRRRKLISRRQAPGWQPADRCDFSLRRTSTGKAPRLPPAFASRSDTRLPTCPRSALPYACWECGLLATRRARPANATTPFLRWDRPQRCPNRSVCPCISLPIVPLVLVLVSLRCHKTAYRVSCRVSTGARRLCRICVAPVFCPS